MKDSLLIFRDDEIAVGKMRTSEAGERLHKIIEEKAIGERKGEKRPTVEISKE